MATREIYRNWDDLVFENRNKDYGAFVLRREYSDHVMKGLFVALSVALLLLLIPSSKKMSVAPKPPKGDLEFAQFIPQQLRKKPTPPAAPEKPKPARRNDLPPLVTTAVVPDPIEEPVAPEPLTGAVGDFTTGQEGTPDGVVTEVSPVAPPPPPFMIAPEVMPAYEGGMQSMIKYIQKHLRYPNNAKRMGAQGTVFVSFIVRGDGTIDKVELVRGFHPDCDREAMRVISMMPGWKGGSHGGVPVSVRMTLPIKFEIPG